MHRTTLAVVLLLCAAAARPAAAQTPTCDGLAAKKKAVAARLLGEIDGYGCCAGGSVAACLKPEPRCPLATRLADDVCRRVKHDRPADEIKAALARRAETMTATPLPAGAFALDEATRAGDAGAPVTVVVYACTRCPFCKLLTEPLHREVATGALAGKVKLYFRPFPLRDHPGSTEGGLAILAAARLGKFWPYTLYVYAHFDQFNPGSLSSWAALVGLDREAFDRAYADPATREALIASKREGIRNKVTATPTLFVNGRRYVYDMAVPAVVDVLLEAAEAARVAR